MRPSESKTHGRAADSDPPNRFERVHCAQDLEHWDQGEPLPDAQARKTEFLPDASQSIITTNDSPDVGFRYSINPYRGCEHGCSYCYARPTHEVLGMGAGLDFETKIMVKHDASRLLREALQKPSWKGELIAISGVTDCYQPIERKLRLTRGLLEVALEAQQCVSIITKNALVVRDLDLLRELAALNLVNVFLSVTTLDADLERKMEPRTSSPAARLRAISELHAAGVPVGAMLAPVIPGLTDHEVPGILKAVHEAGAQTAGYVLVRLPLAVRPVFCDWLTRTYPDKANRVLQLLGSTRGGKLNDSQFGRRMRGTGEYAEQINQQFDVFAQRYGLDGSLPKLDTTLFRPPRVAGGQLSLF